MSKPRTESTKQTHIEQPMDKGAAFWFYHRFRGKFKGTLQQRFPGGDYLVKLSTPIRFAHYNHTVGNDIFVNMGNVERLVKV